MGIWHLWLHRNSFIFHFKVIDESIHKQCIKKAAKYFSINVLTCKANLTKQWMAVTWQTPYLLRGWVKLNANGSSSGNQRGCTQVGLGWVCAQPTIDPIRLGGELPNL